MNKLLRCAIYTRKSSEEGLEQGFNSLDAQREACEAFIKSQQHEGWKLVPTFYDDGGYSGGNMERPALKQLLTDIDQKKINVVVVYKVDRLTRSLADFAKIVEQFDDKGISFVSVTQQFNTTSSMGRLTLNVLLSFAQFEREVTSERIRDKIAASKAKGLWMGGAPPMGYKPGGELNSRTLVVDEDGAALVRHIFERYLALKNAHAVKTELAREGITTHARLYNTGRQYGGRRFSRGHLYKILTNPVYLGKITHFNKVYDGHHPAIIDMQTWEATQAQLLNNRQGEMKRRSTPSSSVLTGLVFDGDGHRLMPSHTQKKSKQYRYYVSELLITENRQAAPSGIRLPALELENLVVDQLKLWLQDESGILDAVSPDAHHAQQFSNLIKSHLTLLDQEDRSRYDCIRKLIKQVCIHPDRIEISVMPELLFGPVSDHPLEIKLTSLAKIERCGMSMRAVIGTQLANQKQDQNLISSIKRGRAWADQLTTGSVKSITQLAMKAKLGNQAVINMIHRAFLAPDIVRSILNGTQPTKLTADFLKQHTPLPIDWDEQRTLFGFTKQTPTE